MMPHNLQRLRSLVSHSVALAAALAAPIFAQSPARTTLVTRVPQGQATATPAGPIASSQRLTLTLTLAPSAVRGAALDQFLADVTSPGSGSYHQWLTPRQFAANFGATPETLAAATTWAQSQGLAVDAVSPSATRITVSGPAAAVENAFATPINFYQLSGTLHFANTAQPSLPADSAGLFTAIEGLTDFPVATVATTYRTASGALTTSSTSFADLATLVDGNANPILTLSSAITSPSPSELAEYDALFRQASAQGITTLATGAFPSALASVTALALPGAPVAFTPFAARPAWQSAPGLPVDGLRYAPDLTASSLADLSNAIASIAAGTRLGNINGVLYELAPTPGLYTQPDPSTPPGTWLAPTGLGQVDPVRLAAAYPRGTGKSYTSFSATAYSPTHGQGTSFTSNVTSGTGGPVPTGTVAFTNTSNGTVIGTVTLVAGSATYTTNTLDGGNYVIGAVYSGDSVYASSSSPTSQLYVQPENSQLTIQVNGNPTVGSNYSVTVTDTAASGVGQPSGPVTVSVSGTSSVYSASLVPASANSASATFSIPATTPGTLTLSTQCTTSANFSCLAPLTSNVTIAKATPTLSISYSPNPPVSGQNITLNATVSTVGNAPAPTGNVQFFDNGVTLNANQLNNGSTTTTAIVPTTATHSITATYAGDSNYNPVSTTAGSSSSGTIATTTVLTASAASVTAGQNITFTATVTPSSTGPAAASGTIQFFDGGAALGTANLNGTQATFTTNTLTATSAHSITAVYSGDGNYTTSNSNIVTLAGNSATTTAATTLTVSTLTPVHGQAVTFTATVAGGTGNPVPTGTVTFSSTQTGPLGQATLVNGVAAYSTTQLPGGISNVTATYNGGTPYSPSTSAAATVNVQTEPVTLSVSVGPNPAFGSNLAVTVVVTGASGVAYPTGIVTVQPSSSGYTTAVTAALTSTGASSAGSVVVNLPAVAAGPVTLVVSYAGDKNFSAGGSVTVNTTVLKAVSTLTLTTTPKPPVSGQPVTLSAQITMAGPVAPTGTIQFKDGTTTLGSAVINAGGLASFTTTLSGGAHTLTASYTGDNNYAAATSPAATTATGTAATSTALTLTPSTVVSGAAVTFSAIITPTTVTTAPTGLVQFTSGTSVLCTALVTASAASCSATPALSGALQVTAVYLGDATYAPSTSPAATLTVTPTATGKISTTTVLGVSATPLPTSGAETLTATVTPASAGSAALSGSIVFYDGVTPIGTSPVNAAGVATAAVNLTGTATTVHTLTAVYSGDALYSSSISTAVSLPTTVTATPAAITLTSSLTSGLAGGNVVLTAQVTGLTSTGTSPTGTVSFYVAGATARLLGTVGLAPAGSGASLAILSTSVLSAGPQTIYAVYNGDNNFTTVTSNSITIGLSDYAITFIPQTLTITRGQSGQATLILNPLSGFAGSVVFGCTPPPDTLITCAFSPTSLTGGGSTTLTVTTQAPRSAAIPVAPSVFALATLLCLLLPRGRRRIPALLTALLALVLSPALGCSSNAGLNPLGTLNGGTPIGTTNLTINTAGSDGINTVRHNYTFQVTIQ